MSLVEQKAILNHIKSRENTLQMEPSNRSLQKTRSQLDAGITTVVGFDDDARRLVEQLVGGKKQLQIISVTGMAGLGKTTLVRKVFNEPSVVYHFYVRAWTTVTQEPKKRDLILGILKSGFNAEIGNCSDMELSATLKRRLSGQRYLVVMDDIWDGKDWNDLMLCFPDDNVGSRIVFTSRLANLPIQVQYQHPLRFLTERESWDLLRYKVFLTECCPSSLIEIGAHIARKCQGLPLLIVVLAGILASDTTTSWWSQVAQDMSSIASNAPELFMETLVLSYNHLPDHLKPCFLYFAAFPEDYEIPAWKLILLWVAEGFIKTEIAETDLEEEINNLEEVAAGYLKDLISRSLVIVSKCRSNGEIKACIVHDALRELCIKKADEVNFLHRMPRYQHLVSKFETPATSLVQRLHSQDVDEEDFIRQLKRYFHLETPSAPMVHRLCISISSSFIRIKKMFTKTLYPNVQTILCCNGSGNSYANIRYPNDHLFDVLRIFKCLSVMDLSSIGLSNTPLVLGSLSKLRYISLCIKPGDNHPDENYTLSKSIHKLKYLETLIVHNKNREFINVPRVEWMSYRLRHLILKGNINSDIFDRIDDPEIILENPLASRLPHLQTLSHQSPLVHYRKILLVTGNLRKLAINTPLYLSSTELKIPNLDKLKHLENLSLQNNMNHGSMILVNEINHPYKELSDPNMFPSTLKKLTLVRTFLKWDEMQKIGMLPNLEVLKIQFEAFRGEHWETSDGGFHQLKHLAFKFIKIVQWSAYREQFPNLQHLKLEDCHQLEEIPIGIGDIYSLDMIEIRNCNPAVVRSAHEIKEDQLNKGNDMLKISIFQA